MSEEIVIRKRRKSSRQEHHGGSWKIAFADFMTAMMALFLLLWLVSITTKEQREGIAMWFNPMAIKEQTSASDGVLDGSVIDIDGVESSNFARGTEESLESLASHNADRPVIGNRTEPVEMSHKEAQMASELLQAELDRIEVREREDAVLQDIMDEIQAKISAAIDMDLLAENLIIEITDEGLRIQITDRDGAPMFPVGSTGVTSHAAAIIKSIGEAVADVPNKVAITGHTDGLAYRDKADFDNFDLSSGRANSARRILMSSGVTVDRIGRVEGLADRSHLVEDSPNDPRNRRISVTLLRAR